MKNHKNIWLSSSGGNLTSWQHTKYVGYKGGSGSVIPIVNDPYSIYAYTKDDKSYHYGWGNMRKVEVYNNIRLTYYVLDESYHLLDKVFNPEMTPLSLSTFPQNYIYHLNGEINGKKYITVKNLSLDYLEPNAKILPLVCVGAFASLSDYVTLNYDDFEFYKNFLQIENEVINSVGYARFSSSLYKVNSYQYKADKNSFGSKLFNDPSVLKDGTLKYRGYDYKEDFFRQKDIKEEVTKISDMSFDNNYPNRFTNYASSNGVRDGSRLNGIVIPQTGWSNFDDEGLGYFPTYVTFGSATNTIPLNTFHPYSEIEQNPYLPVAGKQNPYEIQTLIFGRSSGTGPGRWFHLVTRFWWNPEVI